MSWTDNKIPYDDIVQSALRDVVRTVLSKVAKYGQPGEHHFYIAFKTRAPGVKIPPHLMEKYPDEMTIVLQHRYWDLAVHDDYFEVSLSFNQRREHLVIPFPAILGFVDPSVQFALQFQSPESEPENATQLPTARSAVSDREETAAAPPADAEKPAAAAEGGAMGTDNKDNVVALDAFRKKP